MCEIKKISLEACVFNLSLHSVQSVRLTELNAAVFTVVYCCRSLQSSHVVVPYIGFSTINAVIALRPIGLSQGTREVWQIIVD